MRWFEIGLLTVFWISPCNDWYLFPRQTRIERGDSPALEGKRAWLIAILPNQSASSVS